MNRFCNLINWPHVSVLAGNVFADYGNQNANYGNIFILNVSVKVWVSNVIRFNCLSVSHTTPACRAIRTHSSWFLHLSVRCNITCTFFIIHLFIDKLLRVLYYIQTRSVLQTVYFCNGVYETLNKYITYSVWKKWIVAKWKRSRLSSITIAAQNSF